MMRLKTDKLPTSKKSSWKRRLVTPALLIMLCSLVLPMEAVEAMGPVPSLEPSEAIVFNAATINATQKTIVVDRNGSGQFKTVQSAINSIPSGGNTQYKIQIKKGTYYEKINIPSSKPSIRLVGESASNTILTFNDTNSSAGGTTKSASTTVRSKDFHAENITFSNTAGRNAGQAVAIYVASDRATFRNVRMLGYQDTLYAHSGRQLYENCYIEGTVDFIFGGATAVFKNSEIRSVGNGYITAASTDAGAKYGYVFIDCRLTQTPGAGYRVYLGRPWRPYSAVIFMTTWMDGHIRPEGWNNWNDAANEKTARYAEFNNSGPGWNKRARVRWASTLSPQQASGINVYSVLAGNDGWNPYK